ncbi:hypothetical protein QCD60_17160 [Pokkaliibacter sp. MBI-7]|nr:hypothetical protein [Pokkaliibacter sp. MBI-7]MDH2434289.1 hypothetical protein [Pokkaliibacter sp. MBI-7]
MTTKRNGSNARKKPCATCMTLRWLVLVMVVLFLLLMLQMSHLAGS